MSLDENKIFTFKLYVFKNTKPTEIRKFDLKKTELSFESMEENLNLIFPTLREQKYTILWKDDDEDFITLSTSKEFSTFEAHVTKAEVNETKLFINFEDELFAASQKFEQNVLNFNFSCSLCKKKLALTCSDCTSKKQPKGEKILNIANPGTIIPSNENGQTTSTTSSTPNDYVVSGPFGTQSVFNTPPTSSPVVFPTVTPESYQFASKKSGKTKIFGTSMNNFK